MFSGVEVLEEDLRFGVWRGFQAAHIFPFARESEWTRRNFQGLIEDSSPGRCIGSSEIHSPQNGLLLASHVHELFDTYVVSVNVDIRFSFVIFHLCFAYDSFL